MAAVSRHTRRRRNVVAYLAKQQGNRCIYCRRALAPDRATIEHLVPRSMGGTNCRGNLALACFKCNTSRSSTGIDTFLLSRGLDAETVIERLAIIFYQMASDLAAWGPAHVAD